MTLLQVRKRAGIFAFALAASLAPLATLIPASCGTACGACPLSGGCLAVPAVAVGIGAFGVRSRLGAGLERVRGETDRIRGRSL
ncbi:MAG TPA: hypothetical protein VHN82_07475 [Methanoregula sp.]|nr:hypothetical protein [Methanoregula sp.]